MIAKRLLFLLILLQTSQILRSQDFGLMRSMNFTLDYIQIKESLNYGLVFNGPIFRFSFRKSWEIDKKELIYDGSLGFGPLSTRGMLGLNFRVKPVDLLFNVYKKNRKISYMAGPWLKMEYNYQLYPHIHSGYSFHYTNYTVGFGLTGRLQTDDVYIRLNWKNSVFGLVSRPPLYRNPYFFELDLGTYFKDQHDVFKPGSYDMYNNTLVEVLFVRPGHPRLGYAYTFEYFTYRKEPKLKALSHSFTLFFYPKS